jgi:hypothetical protein
MTYSLFVSENDYPPFTEENWIIARNLDEVAEILIHHPSPDRILFDDVLAASLTSNSIFSQSLPSH